MTADLTYGAYMASALAETEAERSQRLFEAMFDHKPRVDTRTPADIRNGVKLP